MDAEDAERYGAADEDEDENVDKLNHAVATGTICGDNRATASCHADGEEEDDDDEPLI